MRAFQRIASLLILLFPAFAAAQEDQEPAPTPRVAIAPLAYHSSAEGADSPAIVAAAERGVAAAFRATPKTDVVDRETLVRQITSRPLYDKTVDLGESWATMGIDAYKGLDLEGAVRSLRESIDSFREVGHDLVAPRRFAELLMFLSVSHLERRSRMVEPLDRMQEMILYDPGRRLERGFYPDRAVQFYESARVALERDLQRGPNLDLVERTSSLTGADWVASIVILEEEGQYSMYGWLWNPETGQSLPPEIAALDSLDPAEVESAANRLGTRLVACVAQPDEPTRSVAPSEGTSPLAMQLNMAYVAFFTLPGDADIIPFPNLGASFGASWSFTREFSVVTMLQILTSTSEFSGYLQEDFTTLRAFAGVDLGWSFWDFAIGLSTQLEVTKVGDITTCDVDAPGINEEIRSSGCGGYRRVYPTPVLLGVNGRPRITYKLLESLELQVSGSFSYFFVPLNSREINLPVTAETGLLYRF